MGKYLLDKFLNNSCTAEEAAIVLEWLDTPEGQRYLEERLDNDAKKFQMNNLHLVHSRLDSDKIKRVIRKELKFNAHPVQSTPQNNAISPIWRVAAILIIGVVGSIFYFTQYYSSSDVTSSKEPTPNYYQTSEDNHKKLTLSDGTRIRLNSDTQIWIESDFSTGAQRSVRMEGEAFFDVVSDLERPFVIHTPKASIEVLGTTFNVKSIASSDNVQVAVIEGSVSVSTSREGAEKNSVLLAKGQFGYLDNDEFSVENFGVENYLVWMQERLVFEDLNLSQVCTQLTRLYDIECSIADESLGELNLMTNVSSVSSLEKVLSVISLSLDISYKKSNNKVIWFGKKKGDL